MWFEQFKNKLVLTKLCYKLKCGGTIVINEIGSASSTSSSWDWLHRTLSSSSLKGLSSLLGKPSSVVNSGSFGWVDEGQTLLQGYSSMGEVDPQ